MTLEKELNTKGMSDRQRREYIKYYDTVIPCDRPLLDELHLKFIHKYRDKKDEILVD